MSVLDVVDVVSRADIAAFNFINHTLYWQPLADLTYLTANDLVLVVLLLLGSVGYTWWRGWKTALVVGIWSSLAVVCANLMHNEWLKPFFNRTRPFLALPDVHLSAHLKDLSAVSLSFPSTHAASAAALAMVVSHLDRSLRWPAWVFAGCVGAGAIYSGGHYPVDVLVGYVLGWGLGWMLVQCSRWTWPGPEGVSGRTRIGA